MWMCPSVHVFWPLVWFSAALSLWRVSGKLLGAFMLMVSWAEWSPVSLDFWKPKIPACFTCRRMQFQGVIHLSRYTIQEMLHLSAEHESILSVVVPQCTLTPQPLSSRHHAAIHWCHGQPRPQPCALFSLLGKGMAFVSTQLSARSRCRRQRDLQLDVQTPKCSGAVVVIAIFVSPSGEEQWSEAGRVTPLSWPGGRTAGWYLLMLLGFQQEH